MGALCPRKGKTMIIHRTKEEKIKAVKLGIENLTWLLKMVVNDNEHEMYADFECEMDAIKNNLDVYKVVK